MSKWTERDIEIAKAYCAHEEDAMAFLTAHEEEIRNDPTWGVEDDMSDYQLGADEDIDDENEWHRKHQYGVIAMKPCLECGEWHATQWRGKSHCGECSPMPF